MQRYKTSTQLATALSQRLRRQASALNSCAALLEICPGLNRLSLPSIGGKENWELFLVVRGGENVASSVSEKQKLGL